MEPLPIRQARVEQWIQLLTKSGVEAHNVLVEQTTPSVIINRHMLMHLVNRAESLIWALGQIGIVPQAQASDTAAASRYAVVWGGSMPASPMGTGTSAAEASGAAESMAESEAVVYHCSVCGVSSDFTTLAHIDDRCYCGQHVSDAFLE